jgi:hypothetical protein
MRGAIGLLRCTPEHSTLVLHVPSTGPGANALPVLPDTDGDSRNSFAVTGHVCGNRNYFDPDQIATLSPLTLTEAEPPMSFREHPFAATR